MDKRVDDYIKSLSFWKKEITAIRDIILKTNLVETFKWKHPCYTYNSKNVIIIQDFKEYCAVMFLKGSLLNDPNNLLVKLTENVQVERQLRFKNSNEIANTKSYLIDLVLNAIKVEETSVKPKLKETKDYVLPEELINIFESDEEFKNSFHSLTPGRQRGYLLHFSSAKQSSTRIKRIENNITRIKTGFGIDDCICGLSKRMPNCDGSHKLLKER